MTSKDPTTTETNDLMPCPFCGVTMEVGSVNAFYHPYDEDKICILSGFGVAEDKIVAWNTRQAPASGWQDIKEAPMGSMGDKKSHIILINKYGNICRGYKIHDGTGKYAMHDPFYNEHGQTFHPVMWMPLTPPPEQGDKP